MNSLIKKVSLSYFLKFFFIVAIYFVSARFGLSLAYSYKQITLIWPPTGIALAALLIFGLRFWPAITIGAFFANILANETSSMALGIAIGNTLEAFVAAFLLNKLNFERSLNRVKDVVFFIIIAVIFSTTISATIGTLSLVTGGIGSWQNYSFLWINWWVGDLISNLVFGAFLLSWSSFKQIKLNFSFFLQAVSITALTCFISILIFTPIFTDFFSRHPYHFEYIILPFLLWFSYKFKQKGSTLIVLIVSTVAIWGTLIGKGPFMVEGNIEYSLFLLQTFIAIIAITFLVFSAIIEEKSKAEKGLENSEKKFRALIENSDDVVVLINEEARIIYVSPSIKRVLGYEPQEVIGTIGFKLIYEKDVKFSAKSLTKLISLPLGESLKIENRGIKKDGTIRWMELIGTNLLKDPAVGAVVINFRDITERKNLEEAKGEFISLAAHELRSPLSSIRWYTESLLEKSQLKKIFGNELKEIYSSVLKMAEIITLFLNVTKIELGTLVIEEKSFEIDKLCKEIVKNFKVDFAKKKLKIQENYTNKLPKIISDINLVKTVLENVISNSIKYTKAGDLITISVLPEEGDKVLVLVSDTGLGIPQKDQPQIFTKMFRASNIKEQEPSGTGLGLYLSRLILNKIGGSIEFESKEEKGSSFYIRLPIKKK